MNLTDLKLFFLGGPPQIVPAAVLRKYGMVSAPPKAQVGPKPVLPASMKPPRVIPLPDQEEIDLRFAAKLFRAAQRLAKKKRTKMTARTDAQEDERMTRALRWLIGLRPLLLMLGTGVVTISGVIYVLTNNWRDVKDDVKAQGQTIQIHDNLIRNQSAEIQAINVHFARLEQMLKDLQDGRRTSMANLPELTAGSSGTLRGFDGPLPP